MHVLYVLYVCACMLYVWYVLAEASTECICVCIVCMYRVCIFFNPYVHVLHVVYVCACMLYVLYVFAQTSTDASTTSPKDPPLGRHPAGPTQGTPGQVADHFFLPSETHPRPVLAHRRAQHALGDPNCTPCSANRHSACISLSASTPRAPSEMIRVGGALQRRCMQPPLPHKNTSRL